MFSQKTFSIIKRELREKLFSKTFIIMTLLIPVFMFIILGVQTVLFSYGNDKNAALVIISQSENLTNNLKNEFYKTEFVKSGELQLNFKISKSDSIVSYLPDLKTEILSDKLNGIIFIPSSAFKDKKIKYYSKNPTDNNLFRKVRPVINKVLMENYFKDKKLTQDDINFAREKVDINGFKISENEQIKEAGIGNTIAAFLFIFLLYFSLLFLGMMMMRSTVQEKINRIVEVLLSSVNSNELMTGKIIGTAITGLVQMAIWLLPLFLVLSSSIFILPSDFTIDISLSTLLYFLLNYFIGLITFLGLFATVGAIFDNDQDAQSGIWPIMMLIMIPFFIGIALIQNPGNQIGVIASMVPFSSLIVMPARMTLIEVPAWQIIFSFAINISIMFIIFLIAGKIYRVGVLMTGKKPQWSEVIKWLRYKY